MYKYNRYGWYIGEGDSRYSTELKPSNLNTVDSPGVIRAKFVVDRWKLYPYQVPPDLTIPNAVKVAIDLLKVEYTTRLSNFTLSGIPFSDFEKNLKTAEMVISAGKNRFVILSTEGDIIILNAAKLTIIVDYLFLCSEATRTHGLYLKQNPWVNIQQIKQYVRDDMINTLWPANDL